MKAFLTGILALALIAPACAQDGPHSHPATDAVNASQDAEIAKALSADALIVEGMADLDRRIDALEAATAGLSSSTADLAARVKALEDAAAPDPKPVPSISISATPQSAPEGASFVFTLARTGDLASPSSVAYAATGAADAADFAGGVIPSGMISFAAGDASAQVTVRTVDDASIEPDEAFSVTLSNPVGAVLGQPSASVTIVNNDVATPPPPPPPSTGALLPNTADGKPIAQLGVGHHIYWQAENPYKNLRLLYPEYGGGAKVAAGEADPTTGWIFMQPGETLVLGRVRPAQANGINTDPGEYVLKATIRQGSTADITALGFVNNGSSGLTIRKTAILDDQDLNGNEVKLNGGASGGWINVDFWGPTKWEGDPQGWHPDFLKDASRYKIIRFLDWTTTNGSSVTNAAEWIDDGDYTIYNNSNNGQKPLAANGHLRKFGYAYGRMFDLANKADSTVWVNIPLTMGASVIKTELLDCRQSIIKPAIVANFAAIEASAKVEYRLLAEKMARSAVAQNYPNNKVILIELANEVWNYGNSAFACTSGYADGLGMALNGGTDYDAGTGLGHMAVIAFDALEKAFAQIKPGQEVKYVLGVQTMGSTARAKKAAAEFDRYAPTVGVDPKLRQKIFLATTNYFSGGWQWNKNRSPGVGNNPFGVSDEGAFNAAFIAADADGSLFAKLKAWYTGPRSTNVNVARLVTQTTMWRDYAVQNGWRGLINYEGSPADVVGSLPADVTKGRPYDQLGAAYPASAQTWKRWIRSQEAFDVQNAYLQALTVIDTSNPSVTDGGWLPDRLVIANYMLTGRDPNYTAPWQEKNPLEAGMCPPEGFIGAWCKHLRPVN